MSTKLPISAGKRELVCCIRKVYKILWNILNLTELVFQLDTRRPRKHQIWEKIKSWHRRYGERGFYFLPIMMPLIKFRYGLEIKCCNVGSWQRSQCGHLQWQSRSRDKNDCGRTQSWNFFYRNHFRQHASWIFGGKW